MLRQHAWKVAAGAVCAASGLTLQSWSGLRDDRAHCYVAEQSAAFAAAKSTAELAALADWLRQRGADVDAVDFKLCDTVGPACLPSFVLCRSIYA